jgi:hypothetical protein
MNSNFIRVVNSPCDRCKVCGSESLLFDVVDFHGNVDLDPNAQQRKTVFPISGIPMLLPDGIRGWAPPSPPGPIPKSDRQR